MRTSIVLALLLAACGRPSSPCDAYFACLEEVVHGGTGGAPAQMALDQAKAQYGAGGACDQSSAARSACDDACRQGLAAAQQTFSSVSACGASTTDGGSAMSLEVARAAQSDSLLLDGRWKRAPSGQRYWSVDMSLSNGSAGSAPLSTALFSLSTSDGLEFMGAAETALLEGGCPQTASVVSGQSTRCVVVFTLPSAASPTSLRYKTVDGRAATASLTPELCAQCGADCVDVKNDPENCGACGAAVGPLGRCVDGKPACSDGTTACAGTCVDLKNDPKNCGACGVAITSDMTCSGGQRLCYGGSAAFPKIACGTSCVNGFDGDNCGKCGRSCNALSLTCYGTGAGANEYECGGKVSSRKSCAQVCGALQCTKTEASYACNATTSLIYEPACDEVPAASATDGAQTCPFSTIECHCQ